MSACAGIPPEVEHSGLRHEGYLTPRSAQQFEKGKREIRFTPNGTRIPDGSPPKEDNSVSCQGPEPPPVRPAVPPFPQSFLPDERMEKFLDGYEKVEVIPKVLKSERIWEPGREMSTHEARAFWLEREVASLKGSLEKLSDGNQFST